MKNSMREYQEYLDAIHIPLRLACNTQSGWPIVLSLWFLHRGGLLYCATPRSAKVVAYLQHGPQCGFEIAADRPPYCGIRGRAEASIEAQLGAEILEALILRYLGNTENNLAKDLLAKVDNEVAIVLKPTRVYTWDFTNRMAGIPLSHSTNRVCP